MGWFVCDSSCICFNEAGSVRSRKRGAGCGDRADGTGFNEAGSVRSRKLADRELGVVGDLASMRPAL